MNDVRKIGRILLLNVVSSTPPLMEYLQTVEARAEDGEDVKTPFASLTDAQLYSRLLTDINFNNLSEQDKNNFLILKPESEGEDKENVYQNRIHQFVQEAHNRSSNALGVKPTNIVFCDFSKNFILGDGYCTFDTISGNIFVNTAGDYYLQRPTYLLEQINAKTFQHSVYQKIQTAISSPQSLSNMDYFLATATAIKSYLYEENASPFSLGYLLLSKDSLTPEYVASQLFAYEKTRADLQSAGLYGGEIRDLLREAEEDFHEQLQENVGFETLVNHEDVLTFFRGSELSASSNGLLGKIADKFDVAYSRIFFNAIGAEMPEGVTTTEYLFQIEDALREAHGLPPRKDDDDETEEEFFEDASNLSFRDDEEGYAEASFDKPGDDPAEDAMELFLDSEDDEADLPPGEFKSVLPLEGDIQKVVVLPFHEQNIMPSQDEMLNQ